LNALTQRADTRELGETSRHVAYLSEESHRIAYLSEAYLLTGRLADAMETATLALARARQHEERGYEAWAQRVLGDVALCAEPLDDDRAEGYYRQALALANDLGMRPLAAQCHLGLGTLYRKVGRDTEAQRELATAAEMYRAMEMTFWLARAEAALA
jgi:tetratricopeptide (TPR) repeat protein